MKNLAKISGIQLALVSVLCGCGLALQVGAEGVAASPRSSGGPYDFYPGPGTYPSGGTADFPWATPAGGGFEGFESYPDGSPIESSDQKGLQSHLEVTSGALTAKHLSQGVYRRARTENYNFRMLIQGLSNGMRVKWRDQAVSVRFYVDSWQPTGENWQGVHLFARYRTEDDLYVASLRKDGEVFIKKVLGNGYTTLAEGLLRDQAGNPRPFNTRQWYKMSFAAIGNRLNLTVDGVPQLEAYSGTFSWGTLGIRTDYANVYLDDLTVPADLTGY